METIYRVPLWRTNDAAMMKQAVADAIITESPEPELHVFPAAPEKNTGIAVIICPGGGYGILALGAEGHLCAAHLASLGITGMVLQYRLPKGNKNVPGEDMHSAMTYARTHACDWGFFANMLGVIGFSAGGHLAALASTAFTETPVNTRPDFSILFYPVISMEKRKRGMTRINLLGRHASEQDIETYSCHTRVTQRTPPTLLLLCDDDPMVPSRHSILYYEALKQHNVQASMHIFPEGGHAWGFGQKNAAGLAFRYGKEVRSLVTDWIQNTMKITNFQQDQAMTSERLLR